MTALRSPDQCRLMLSPYSTGVPREKQLSARVLPPKLVGLLGAYQLNMTPQGSVRGFVWGTSLVGSCQACVPCPSVSGQLNPASVGADALLVKNASHICTGIMCLSLQLLRLY